MLAIITAVLAVVGYRQLTALRDEARRQRTYELYSRYYSESFLAPRLAVTRCLEEARTSTITLTAAYLTLDDVDTVHFDRYVNFLEEAAQQYLAGLLDREVADQGLAYLAWFHWPRFQGFVNNQRAEQHTLQVCENWEALHHELGRIYAAPSEQDATELADSWIAGLASNKRPMRRRLGRLAAKEKHFRVGRDWEPMPWTEALTRIAADHGPLKEFCRGPMTVTTPPGQSEQVVCSHTPNSIGGETAGPAAVLQLRAVWHTPRWRSASVKYVVCGFASYENFDDAIAAVAGPPESPQSVM